MNFLTRFFMINLIFLVTGVAKPRSLMAIMVKVFYTANIRLIGQSPYKTGPEYKAMRLVKILLDYKGMPL